MRADRLLSILFLLQVHRRLTSRELAERLEVSERTIHRDMEALSATGVPVIAERGAGGGWTLPGGYQTKLTGLNPDEIQALFMAGPVRLLADLGLEKAAEAARLKLQASLPSVHRQTADFVRQRIHVDLSTWQGGGGERLTLLPTLQDAIWQERKLHLAYQRNDGAPVERLVDPLGLVAKGSTWYLIAGVEGKLRTYRVSRIHAATPADQPCVRPEGFDLAAYWAQSVATFVADLPRYPARVRVAPEIQRRLRFAGRFAKFEETLPPDEDGWQELTIRFETINEASEYALSFGPYLEVLEPAELRAKVLELAERTVAFYRERTTGSD